MDHLAEPALVTFLMWVSRKAYSKRAFNRCKSRMGLVPCFHGNQPHWSPLSLSPVGTVEITSSSSKSYISLRGAFISSWQTALQHWNELKLEGVAMRLQIIMLARSIAVTPDKTITVVEEKNDQMITENNNQFGFLNMRFQWTPLLSTNVITTGTTSLLFCFLCVSIESIFNHG